MKCRFDKSKNLIRAYALYLKNKGNKEVYEPNDEFLAALADAFDNPETAAQAIEELVGANNPAPTGSPIDVKNVELTGNYRRSEDSENISSYYTGDPAYRRMISKFRKDILGASILSIDLDRGTFKFFDGAKVVNPNLNITQLQSNILLYKQKLLNNLLKAINPSGAQVSLSESMDDYSFTKTVDDIIAMFEAKLTEDNRAEIEANGYYDDYVILKNFDRLVDRYASYITIDSSYRKNKWEGVKKYALMPKVKHYSGFSKDEGADVSKQISDLAETILKVIPEIDANGHIIENSIIGTDGFNGSMMTLKRALLYSQNLGENSASYRKAYSRGADAILNVFEDIINDFITNNTSKEGESVYSDFRQLYLHNKLRGIAKFLMSKDTPADIKNMFAQMFVKTEPSTYRVYTYDAESNMMVGKDLKSRMTVTQKRAIQSVIQSGIGSILNGSRRVASDLAKKYSINISEDNGVETIEIVNTDTNQKAVLSYTFDKNGKLDNLTIDEGGDTIFENMMRDMYAYIIPDTYATCIAESNYDWKTDFAPFIVLAAKQIKTKLGDTARGRSLNVVNGRDIDLGKFNNDLLKIGRRLGVIYGDSIHNTIKNLNGNNLPLFQLTSLEYNWRMCLDDAKENYWDNPMQESIFWENEDLLTEPQRRSEVAFNKQVKSPAKLNLEELLKLSIIDDFLMPYKNGDTIYFQNTTFSDKVTHFLPGFRTKLALKGTVVTSIFGEGKSLHDIITDALKNGTSKIIEWGRIVQMKQTGMVLENILRDYANVFGWTDLIPVLDEDDKYYKNILKCAKKLSERIKDYDIKKLRDAFAAKHIVFKEEIHATVPKANGLGKCRLNETMLSIFESSTDSKLWVQRTERDRTIFKNDLKRTKLYGFTPGMEKQINSIREIKGVDHNQFYDPILHEYSLVSKDGVLNPIAEVYFALDQILSNQFNFLTVGDFWAHTNKNKEIPSFIPITYSRYSANGYEVSSAGDARFSARNAKFKEGTILFGHDVSGRTIESVYQHGVKQNDWNTNNNNKTGVPQSHLIINGDTEDDSYRDGYLPLWQEWASQNPELINELIKKSKGKVLTDQFASTKVSQARALADIINTKRRSDGYLIYSEANRFVNQIKRNVIFGSTIHPFAQGIKDDNGYEIGVTPEISIAIISDQDGLFYTPAGIDSKGDAQDGCGWCTALESILENNSLVDAKVGDNKKTILHDIDHRYGTPTLLKWAVYSLTNSVRRNGKQSVASVENLVYKMYNVKFGAFDADLNSDYQDFKRKNGPIWVYDLATCTYKEITGIQKGIDQNNNTTYQTLYADGTTSKPIIVDNLYAIDQLFGGAWTFDKNSDGTFSGNEASSYLLANIACKYNLRDKQIAYAVNASGCKVGASNLNDKERWTDNNSLQSYKVSTKYAGAMMDADHELDMAEVTEMSQMISALMEDGFYTDIVTNIYQEIGEIALNNAKTQKYIKAVEEGDRAKIAELLGKSLIASFQTGNKDTIGLAQAFIKKADAEFKKAKLEGKASDYTIPFSDPTIFGAFVADITSRFNKDAIRRKYEGFAGIMNPSYNMMQYFRNGDGENKLFQQFNEECKQKLEPFFGTLPDWATDWVDLAQSAGIHLTNLQTQQSFINPMMIPISQRDIDFEDSIIIEAPDGTLTSDYINTQEKYDYYKHLLDLSQHNIYKNTARPRNLRGVDVKLTVRGVNALNETVEVGTFSYYSIDSVRAALYLQKGIKPDDPFGEVKQNLIAKVCGTITDPVKQLEHCISVTQTFLEKLDKGKEYAAALTRGEVGNLSKVGFGYQECFGATAEPLTYYASDYNVRPAEIIIGRYQFDKLGLTDQDHIWQIKDSRYFLNKLQETYKQVPVFDVETKVGRKLYDRVLYHKGQPFLVKVGKITHGDDGIKETNCVQNNIVGDDLRWESEVILTNETDDEAYLDKFKFTYVEDGKGTKLPMITVESWEDLDDLTESDFFDDFYRKNAYGRKSEEIQLEEAEMLANLAETRFEAFKEALKFVGARIPTQAMQSFIPADVIAVTDSKLNAAYFPVSGMLIEGADLDGDKIYLLTCTLLNNGKIQSGSALQKLLGYKTTSRLLKGKDTTFQEGPNGYPMDGNVLAQFMVPTSRWTQDAKDAFVYHANKLIGGSFRNGVTNITFVKPEGIDDELFEKQKKKFLNLLNKHSKTKSYIRDSIETLKSRVFNGIRQVTLGAQSQLKAQITVDSCTEEFKQAATNTTGGKTEKTISPRIPSSKFQMQVQGILGKSVVGIGAVSLKTYFMLCTAYNRKVGDIIYNLKMGWYSKAEAILETMKITNPFTGETTTLSGTNLNRILELEDEVENWPTKNVFFDTIRKMRTNSSRLAPAESLSSIVSLSADNMKDLALPKLNATEDLVDIYTTAFMIGIPFSEISRIMTSPIFTVLTEEGKNNIFDSYTDDLKVKDLIADFLSDTKVKKVSLKLDNIARKYNTSTNSVLPDGWYFDNTLVDKVIYEFTRKGGIIDSTQEYVNYDEMSEELDENGNPIQVQQVLKNDVYNLYRYLQFLHRRNELIGSNVDSAMVDDIDFNGSTSTNDPERFAGEQESAETISSEKTILSNEELQYWNEQGVGEMPRILVASERTDPAFHVQEILDVLEGRTSATKWDIVDGKRVGTELSGKDFAGLYIITKHDGLPIRRLLQTKIPKLIHFSITTVGGTKYEPGVMKYNDLLDRISEYIKQGLDPNSVTIRIDPIIPGVTAKEDIENVVRRASEMGIKRIRFSIMDAYKNTRKSMEALGYDFSQYYGDGFFASNEYINDICNFMLSLKDKYNITLGTCAEAIVRNGISKEGCLSVSAVNNMLGTSIEDKGTENNSQRKLCSCYGGKVDALQYNAACASHCVYCYAKHESDAAMNYYDRDGKLIRNKWTMTSRPTSILQRENPLSGLIKLQTLLPYVEEMSTLGREGSINQGLKTNITDYYKFEHNLEAFINGRLPLNAKVKFSFKRYLEDKNYRDMWIEYVRRTHLLKGFNILETLTLSPNFFNMLKLIPTVTSLLEISQTYKIATAAADYFKENKKVSFSKFDFDETARYIQDLRIFNFLKNSGFELDLDEVADLTKKDLEIYLTSGSLDRSSMRKLTLNSGLNMASFKLLMETSILPHLKSKYSDNSFIRDLLMQENNRTKVNAEALPIPMMNIDRDEGLSARYTKYLQDFNAIANISFAGVKIGDLFFLYNLIVNKNQFGQLSFTRIFEDLINNKETPKYIKDYYTYCSSLEGTTSIDGFSFEDLAYRLAKYSKDTKVETGMATNTKLPPDLTLDLPFLYREYNLFDTEQNKYRWSRVENLDPGDVIDALVNSLSKTGQKIFVITDEDVEKYKLPKERGFIKDGAIYINKSRFNDASSLLGVAIHELSHAILAAIKTSDSDTKQRYYTLLDSLKEDPEFETIAAMYPDRVGSDLLEEVFCNKLEKLLTNKISQNSKVELAIINDGLLLKGLKTLFKDENITVKDSLFNPLANLLEFASDLFSFENPISSDFTTASQKLAELKTRLFNSKEDRFKLDQVCK